MENHDQYYSQRHAASNSSKDAAASSLYSREGNVGGRIEPAEGVLLGVGKCVFLIDWCLGVIGCFGLDLRQTAALACWGVERVSKCGFAGGSTFQASRVCCVMFRRKLWPVGDFAFRKCMGSTCPGIMGLWRGGGRFSLVACAGCNVDNSK